MRTHSEEERTDIRALQEEGEENSSIASNTQLQVLRQSFKLVKRSDSSMPAISNHLLCRWRMGKVRGGGWEKLVVQRQRKEENSNLGCDAPASCLEGESGTRKTSISGDRSCWNYHREETKDGESCCSSSQTSNPLSPPLLNLFLL